MFLSLIVCIAVAGDAYKSVHCLAWRENGKRLDLLARDYSELEVTAAQFCLDGSKRLNIAVADGKKNLQVMTLSTGAVGIQAGCVYETNWVCRLIHSLVV